MTRRRALALVLLGAAAAPARPAAPPAPPAAVGHRDAAGPSSSFGGGASAAPSSSSADVPPGDRLPPPPLPTAAAPRTAARHAPAASRPVPRVIAPPRPGSSVSRRRTFLEISDGSFLIRGGHEKHGSDADESGCAAGASRAPSVDSTRKLPARDADRSPVPRPPGIYTSGLVMKRKKYPYPLNYRGNLFILVFSFAWPPLAAALLVKNLAVQNRERRLHLEYRGKFGWIVFWSLFFSQWLSCCHLYAVLTSSKKLMKSRTQSAMSFANG